MVNQQSDSQGQRTNDEEGGTGRMEWNGVEWDGMARDESIRIDDKGEERKRHQQHWA